MLKPIVNALKIIIEITKNSPAMISGLEAGDVILTVNGQEVNKTSDIRTIILENDLRSGDKVDLRIFRNGKYKKVKMTLGKFSSKSYK